MRGRPAARIADWCGYAATRRPAAQSAEAWQGEWGRDGAPALAAECRGGGGVSKSAARSSARPTEHGCKGLAAAWAIRIRRERGDGGAVGGTDVPSHWLHGRRKQHAGRHRAEHAAKGRASRATLVGAPQKLPDVQQLVIAAAAAPTAAAAGAAG